jgi:hypothetical protein
MSIERNRAPLLLLHCCVRWPDVSMSVGGNERVESDEAAVLAHKLLH